MIAVIGAGISGLTAAYELQKACEDVIVFDASDRAGGLIHTVHEQGYNLEYGPASVFADDSIEQYLIELGLGDQFIHPHPDAKEKYILKNGSYRKAPSGPKDLFLGSFLSLSSKMAILNEIIKGKKDVRDESIGAFIERRFGKEITDYLLTPLVGGIYAGDCYQLLADKTFPFLVQFEKKYGSVIKGFLKKAPSPKKSIYLKNGLQGLTEILKNKIRRVSLGTRVEAIEPLPGGFKISFISAGESRELICSSVILAVPAYVACSLLGKHFPAYAAAFGDVKYASVAKVFLGFDKKKAVYDFKGYGALNPPVEHGFALAALWTGSVYPCTTPEGKQLVTGYVGGVLQEGHMKMKDDYLIARVACELNSGFNASVEPELAKVIRLKQAIPQYDKAVREAQDAAIAIASEGIFICSNWTNGAGVADCIKQAKTIALRVMDRRAEMVHT